MWLHQDPFYCPDCIHQHAGPNNALLCRVLEEVPTKGIHELQSSLVLTTLIDIIFVTQHCHFSRELQVQSILVWIQREYRVDGSFCFEEFWRATQIQGKAWAWRCSSTRCVAHDSCQYLEINVQIAITQSLSVSSFWYNCAVGGAHAALQVACQCSKKRTCSKLKSWHWIILH